MKKIFHSKILIILIFVLFFSVFIYKSYLNRIDTKYAIEFSKVLQTYDIQVIDTFFSEHTQLIYKGEKSTYKEMRNNVIIACQEKKYVFNQGSSYGYGNDKFISGVQDVGIRLYGTLNGDSVGECNLKMKLRKKGLFSFEVESIESNNAIFGYLFYGIK